MFSSPVTPLNLGLCLNCGFVNEEARGTIECSQCGETFSRSGMKTKDYGYWPLLAPVVVAALAIIIAMLLD